MLALFERHGWGIGRESGGSVSITRPGATSETSGNVNADGITHIFSTNTVFEPSAAGHGNPHTPFAVFAILEQGGDFSAAARALHRREIPHEDEGADAHLPQQTSQPVPDDMEARRFRVFTASEMKAREPVPFLVEGLIPDASLVTLIGKSGVLKSFIAVDIGLSLAAGISWHGRDTTQGPVLYVSGEGAGGFGQRIGTWEIARSCIAPDTFLVITDAPQLVNAEHVEAIIATARDHGVRVVFLDTLARTMGGDENSTKDMSAYVTACNRVQRETGAAVIVVHHMGWNADRGRGSSALFAAVDVEATVTREDTSGPATLSVTKAKEFEEPPALVLMPRIITLPNGATSLALDTVAPDPARLSDETRRVGRILLDIFGAAGATATQWQKATEDAGIKPTKFYQARARLATLGFITVPRDDKEKRGWFYRTTDAFTSSLRDHFDFTSRSEENDHFVTSPPIYRGEVRSDFSGAEEVMSIGVTSEEPRPDAPRPTKVEPHLWATPPKGVTYRPKGGCV